MTKTVFITGASKGIGKALAETYFNEGWQVITFARTKSDLPSKVMQIQVDLTDSNALKKAFDKAFTEVNTTLLRRFTLINNAGRLGEITLTERLHLDDIALSVQLNVTAVMQLTALTIGKLKDVNAIKTIVNLSSGAASNPYAGWSVYCASKAAIDMFTKTVALEQEEAVFPFKVIGIRPGVVATNMQEQIRNTPKKDFNMVDKFIALYKNNQLSLPLKVAEKMYDLEEENSIKTGTIVDLREL